MNDTTNNNDWQTGDSVKVFTSRKGYANATVTGRNGALIEVELRDGTKASFHASRIYPI